MKHIGTSGAALAAVTFAMAIADTPLVDAGCGAAGGKSDCV